MNEVKLYGLTKKKWNLDGPGGFKFYWHDSRMKEITFSKRQSGGGFLMVWDAFSVFGKSKLAILGGNQKSGNHIRTLNEYILPFVREYHTDRYIFQQDLAPIHASTETRLVNEHGNAHSSMGFQVS